ncbi:uncharacterized protein PAC_06956 [Phialocephala subalpina]|uniref:BTB domain-containing protein n=1 Tax=Phialocephala subalpina TaxID=576137 RepID=A0A1L7WWC0_9HELO|nr:uncharacterized protein PAC_06956 [Phialocephala subalpina]
MTTTGRLFTTNARLSRVATTTTTPREIIIDESGDLIIRVYKKSSAFDPKFQSSIDSSKTIDGEILAIIKVTKKTLVDKSVYFAAMLAGGFGEAKQDTIDLEDEQLWFRHFHDSFNEASYKVLIPTIWGALKIAQFYNFKTEDLEDWFGKWLKDNGGDKLEKFTIEELQTLLYPCQEFDNPHGFAHATRRLVYETEGHIKELFPKGFSKWSGKHLHLHPRIITSINAARGSLKTKIHQGIYSRRFFSSSCSCKMEGYFQYGLALDKTGVWPLEEVMHGRDAFSLQQILQGLGRFGYKAPNETCNLCSQDFATTVVGPTVDRVQRNFEGLCLDCIDKGEKRDWDFEYRYHQARRVWDMAEAGCRFEHSEPTWYFSWMARKQAADFFERERDARKRKASEMD